jgi:MFS family permease
MSSTVATSKALSKHSLQAWVAWFCAASFYLYQFILRVSPSVMTNDLMKDFSVHACALGVLGGLYYNTYAAMQIPLGILLDRFGPRRLISLSCAVAALGALLFALAPSLLLASIGRLLMGVGAACGFIGTLKLATLLFPIHHMGRVVGYTMVLGTFGATCGGAPLGFLVDAINWRNSMLLIACAGFILAFCIFVLVRYKKPHTPEKDILHDKSLSILDGLMTVMITPQAWLIGLFGCLLYVPLAAIADLWGTPFFAELYQFDRKIAASMISFIYVGIAVVAPFAAYFSDRLKSRKIPMLMGAIGSFLIYSLIIYGGAFPIPVMCALLFLAGAAFTGQCFVFATITELMPLSASGVALGFINMLVMLSGVIFEPLVGFLLDTFGTGTKIAGVPHFTTTEFQLALTPIPVCLFLAIFVLKGIKETYVVKGS